MLELSFTENMFICVKNVSTRWEFRTDGFDIGFGVVQFNGKKEIEVVPIQRYSSHLLTYDGSFTCNEESTCKCKFEKFSHMQFIFTK